MTAPTVTETPAAAVAPEAPAKSQSTAEAISAARQRLAEWEAARRPGNAA